MAKNESKNPCIDLCASIFACLVVICIIGIGLMIATPFINANIRELQEQAVIELSQSTIVKIERNGNYGLALTASNRVYLLNEEHICLLKTPNSINIHRDKNDYFILTEKVSIISINNPDFSSAIDYFSIYQPNISSLQQASIFDKCDLVIVGEPMLIGRY